MLCCSGLYNPDGPLCSVSKKLSSTHSSKMLRETRRLSTLVNSSRTSIATNNRLPTRKQFEAILMSKAQADALELFLTEEYCVENLHFIWDIRSYKDKVQRLDLTSQTDRDILAEVRERIKTDYLLPTSNKEVL